MPDMKLFELFKKIESEKIQEETGEVFLLVGLGNPGREYEKNRHNIGFMVIEEVIQDLGLTGKKVKCKAVISEGKYNGKKIITAKPQTYMNLSGEAVQCLVRFYKVEPNHMMVIHDDLDLPFGTIRIRPKGGAGGQKGIGSIIQRMGTQEFGRLRVGIGRPPGRMNAADYVLQDFSKNEKEELPFLLNQIKDAVRSFLETDLETAMNKYNGNVIQDEV